MNPFTRIAAALVAALGVTPISSQARIFALTESIQAQPATPDGDRLTPSELEELLGSIALYPDPLLANVLAASVYPDEVAQAAKFVASGGKDALGPGKHTITYEFIPYEAKPGTGGKSILLVNGKKVAEGHIPKTQPFVFSADEGVDVGLDSETNVSPDYKQGNNRFTGKIIKVTVEQR